MTEILEHPEAGAEELGDIHDYGFREGDEVFGDPPAELRIGGVLQPDDRPKYVIIAYSPREKVVILEERDKRGKEGNPPKVLPLDFFLKINPKRKPD